MRRIISAGAAVVVALGLLWVPGTAWTQSCPFEPIPPEALRRYEADMLRLINEDRTSAGMAPVSVNSQIVSIARDHARRMAGEGRSFHNDAYLRNPSRVGAKTVGENVGYGGCTPEDRHQRVMNSPADRRTVLTAQWRQVGIGLASDEAGTLYLVAGFAQPLDAMAEPVVATPVQAAAAPRAAAPPASQPASPQRTATRSHPPAAEVPATEAPAVVETDDPDEMLVGLVASEFSSVDRVPAARTQPQRSASGDPLLPASAVVLMIVALLAAVMRRPPAFARGLRNAGTSGR